jgi:predicted nucleic acid-binding protein
VKLVLDASVAVAAVRPIEPTYLRARARVDAILTGRDELVVPAIFPIEVTSALARAAAWPQSQIAAYVATLLAAPCRVAAIGAKRALAVAHLAATTRLRAADAVYVWLASKEGVVLVTSDEEILRRGGGVCQVQAP